MKLQDIIKMKLSKYSNIDLGFRQLIFDHKEYIIDTSFELQITPQIREIYMYRNNKLILENTQVTDLSIMWIIFFINNINPLDYLGNLSLIRIPDESVIQSLYKKYLMAFQ
jgi:hypothetical protein